MTSKSLVVGALAMLGVCCGSPQATPDVPPPEPARALLQAVRNDSVQEVRRILSFGTNADVVIAGDGPPLCLAAATGDAALVRVLLDAGASVDLREGGSGAVRNEPPLFAVVKRGPCAAASQRDCAESRVPSPGLTHG
jgi:hypothetical protein